MLDPHPTLGTSGSNGSGSHLPGAELSTWRTQPITLRLTHNVDRGPAVAAVVVLKILISLCPGATRSGTRYKGTVVRLGNETAAICIGGVQACRRSTTSAAQNFTLPEEARWMLLSNQMRVREGLVAARCHLDSFPRVRKAQPVLLPACHTLSAQPASRGRGQDTPQGPS